MTAKVHMSDISITDGNKSIESGIMLASAIKKVGPEGDDSQSGRGVNS